MNNKENVILIASAPKGYGQKVVTNRLNQMSEIEQVYKINCPILKIHHATSNKQ
ncbi:hypothetical protein [Niallia sp. 01092]|uniref:hypothetical protein n=1 Tax=unclassified Niallia TaxID=2837522 RepID=UPI003FD35750